MSEKIVRFDIPSRPTAIEIFRAFRTYLEKTTGKQLSPGWYKDSEDRPELYEELAPPPDERTSNDRP